MRLFTLLICVFAFTALSAQSVSVDADGPVLAYKTETQTTNINASYALTGRERTLLGDLDLSGAWGGPTYNYSATGDDWALLRGGFGGLEFSDELFIGYGGWKSREEHTVDNPTSLSPKFDYKHSGLIIAYSPFAYNAIHPRITTVFGPGRFEILDDSVPGFTGERDDRFLAGQATIGLELNLFQWFRLGIDGGYRFASGIDNELVTADDVSGAIIQAEARFGFSW
ncbi:hypothetical protein FUA23_08820 [Neolewinella aurantiaca]|uniref:Outer membrane protein beta-barrel domain-containing protein n=1 Tax=Neolewinella aurantiaca TaxID=2602767 RepID=A0A5C7FPW0_9BACT|nr:hypothetical protein [Neolewinella aurantiaca]TXF89780.1 hypothetical protein FUA23_08820 [Neolewinella aurantiaca]